MLTETGNRPTPSSIQFDYEQLKAQPLADRMSVLHQCISAGDRVAFEQVSAVFDFKNAPQVRMLIAGAITLGHVDYLGYLQSQIHGMEPTLDDYREQVACMYNRLASMKQSPPGSDTEYDEHALQAKAALFAEALGKGMEPRMVLLERQAQEEYKTMRRVAEESQEETEVA